MSGVLLEGGEVLTPAGRTRADVLIRSGHVVEVGPNLVAASRDGQPGGFEVIDITGCLVGPGFVDLHTHLREPGHEWKEDIGSGSAAAAAGGFTAVVAMPNTDPPTDAGHLARYISERGDQVGLVEVVPAGCISARLEGRRLAHLDDLLAARVRIFSDDGVTLHDAGLLRRAMEYLESREGVLAQHAEDPGLSRGGHMHEGETSSLLGLEGLPALAETVVVARDLAMAAWTGARYHVQHVSCASTVELIHAAKQDGVPVTAEVTPHHLWFTDHHVASMDPVYKMYPPLRSPSDVEVLVEGLREGVIDAVATDHAPHAAHEKEVPFEEAPRGVIGLETAFAAVRTKLDPDPRLLFQRMSVEPAAIAGLEGQGRWVKAGSPANLVVVEWDATWTPEGFVSKSANSPFSGTSLTGRVRYTFYRGRCTYDAAAAGGLSGAGRAAGRVE